MIEPSLTGHLGTLGGFHMNSRPDIARFGGAAHLRDLMPTCS